jgi:two-component system, cell cycle sensor histidine kinase and response regulator CckA
MANLMSFFAKADAQDWLATLVGPAALFTRHGQISAGNEAFFAAHKSGNIDALLRDLVDAGGAFRISKAVRRGATLDEAFENLHVRVGPIGALSLVRLYPPAQTLSALTPAPAPPPVVVKAPLADASSPQRSQKPIPLLSPSQEPVLAPNSPA